MFGSPVAMDKPVCLSDTASDGKLCVQQSALQVLEQIQQPVVVVAVVGLYRTGKSYLMNRLAGKQTGQHHPNAHVVQMNACKSLWGFWCVVIRICTGQHNRVQDEGHLDVVHASPD